MKSKPPAVWLDGKEKHVYHPSVDLCFFTLYFEEERRKLFLKNLNWLQMREVRKGEEGAVL